MLGWHRWLRWMWLLLLASLVASCTVGGTVVGRAIAPPDDTPDKHWLVFREGSLTRDMFLQQVLPTKGDSMWVIHGRGLTVTMGTYAGTNPEDVAHERVRLGGRRYQEFPDVPPGILISSNGNTVAIPMSDVTRVRVVRRPESSWAVGTVIGVLLDVTALFVLAKSGHGVDDF